MKKYLLALPFLFAASSLASAAETKGVVVTIKPLHSLVQGVMGETGTADLIVDGYESPHGYQLKPSQVRNLQTANFVFYIGDGFERFLSKSLGTLPDHVRKISMEEKARLEVLENREGGGWEAHDHSAHAHEGESDDEHEKHADHDDHDKHDKHGHKDDHDDHEKHADHKGHDHKDEHDHEAHNDSDDHHFWLSPKNAVEMVKTVTKELSKVYPENKRTYKDNAKALIQQIETADQQISSDLKSVKDVPYIVFHDAYQYFEKHYKLTGVGSILLEPDDKPGIARLKEIRAKINETGAACIFREPQFSDKLVNTALEGTKAKAGTLDPIGAELKAGSGQYVTLLKELAANLKSCLGAVG